MCLVGERSNQFEDAELKDRFCSHLDEFVSVQYAAQFFGGSEKEVRRLLSTGDVRGVNVGNSMWVWQPSLRRFHEESGR